MLHNRKRELEYLNTRFASRRAEFVVLYGRRRVGKTSLLYHWSQEKKPNTSSIFFFATNDDSQTLLKRFSQLIRQVEHERNGVDLDIVTRVPLSLVKYVGDKTLSPAAIWRS